MIPGRTLHRLAGFLCSPASLERIVEPAIADFQSEYASVPTGRRFWILLTGYVVVLEVIVMSALETSMSPHDERRQLRRMLFSGAGIATVVVCLLVSFVIVVFEPQLSEMRPVHVLFGFPIMLPLALPIGLTLGIAFAAGRGALSPHIKKVMLATAVIVSILSLSTLILFGPMTAKTFQQAVSNARRFPTAVALNGYGMTLSELRKATVIAETEGHVNRVRRLRSNYHQRWAISLAAVVLALFVFAVKERWSAAPRAFVCAACGGYFLLFIVGEALMFEFRQLAPLATAWLPNAVFGGATLLLHRS